MKIVILIFAIILAFVGFTFVSFIQGEISEFQVTTDFEFKSSAPKEVEAKSVLQYSHRISYYDTEDSLIESVSEGNKNYISVYYYFDGKLVLEEFKYQNNLEIKLANRVEGDLLISIPIHDDNWNVDATNINHDNFRTYITAGFNMYLIKSNTTGYNKINFDSNGKVIKLGYEIR